MAEITNVSKLIINYLTEEQYKTAKASGLINENELYVTEVQDSTTLDCFEELFTATEDQTLFTLTEGTYQVGKNRLTICVNGTQQPSTAYTEISSSSFTFDSGLSAGDSVIARYVNARIVSNITTERHKASHYSGGTDALTPSNIGAATSTHTHGNLTNEGAVGSTPNLPIFTGASGLLETKSIEDAQALLATGKKVCRFIVGTSTAGWTTADCDYLCDGTADDVKINAAITALPATGGEIVILDGTYNITAKIDVTKDNVSIRGNGNATILKRMFESASPEGVITLTGRSGCKIANLQVDGNKSSYTEPYNFGIYLENSSSDNTVTGNTCNNSGAGICLYTCDNNTVTGNTCNNNGFGIYLYSSSNDTVTGNTCNNNDDSGIYLCSPSNNNIVTGNTCNNNHDHGIHLYDLNINNTIAGNICNNNSISGIYSLASSDSTVTDNTCNYNSNSGIHLHSSRDNTVTGNTYNKNNIYGIQLFDCNNDTITGNTCNNNYSGIYLQSSSNNTVTGNTCVCGTGLSTDYTEGQDTIELRGTANNYNLISNNNCMGKAVTNEGGTGNSVYGNKYDSGDYKDFTQDEKTKLYGIPSDVYSKTEVDTKLTEVNVIAYAVSPTAPSNEKLLWIDTNVSTGGLKYHNGTAWVTVPVGYSS